MRGWRQTRPEHDPHYKVAFTERFIDKAAVAGEAGKASLPTFKSGWHPNHGHGKPGDSVNRLNQSKLCPAPYPAIAGTVYFAMPLIQWREVSWRTGRGSFQ